MAVTEAHAAMSSRATQAVLGLAAYGLAGTVTELPRRPLRDEDWELVARETAGQRLSGLLMAAIEDDAMPVTPAQRERARAYDTYVAARCMQLEGLLLRTERVLSRAQVPIRVLKGPAVANLDYPDPRLRPFIDVDVLVRAADFDTAAGSLREAGLRRCYPEPRPGFDRRFGKGANFAAPDGTAVDLHRTFVMGPYGLRVQLDDLWEAPDTFVAAGRAMPAMSVEARLLHACYHAVLGDWPRRLLPHRDVVQILLHGQVRESTLFEMARRWQAEALLAMGVEGAWDVLGLQDDHPVARWARSYTVPAADLRRVAVYSHEQHNFAAKSLAAVRSVPGLRDKLAFLRALALPERDYVLDRHPSPLARLVHGMRQVRAR